MKQMLKSTVLALSLLPVAALPVGAESIFDQPLSAEDRAALREEFRAFLLDEPEILMEALAVLEQRQVVAQAMQDADIINAASQMIFDDGFSHVGGNPEGDVTIVEFIDYRCGYCRKAFPEVNDLVDTDGNIRIIYKEFPILGEESLLAGRFAVASQLALGEEAYGKLHDALMTMRGNVTEKSLKNQAERLGLDGDAIWAEMENPEIEMRLGATQMLASQLGLNGTPSFIIGDQIVRGYEPLASMAERVETARTNNDG